MKKEIINIRLLQKKDLKNLVKFRNNPIIWKKTLGQNLGFKNRKITLNDELKWFKKVQNLSNRFNLAITLNENYIGNLYFTNIKKNNSELEVFIGEKKNWGKGYGFKAIILGMQFAKFNLKIYKFHLRVRKNNIRAINLYKKSGFKINKLKSRSDLLIMYNKI
jgi:RimJ/RimL family protein N-acetyltransferase